MSDKKHSLGIAYAVKKKNLTAKTEKRPMPAQTIQDKPMVQQNDAKKPLVEADMTSRPELTQTQKNNGRVVSRIKHPSMVQSPAFSTKLRDDEDHIESSMPPKKYEGMSEDRQHYAKGGMINEEVSIKDADEDQVVHPEGLESSDDQKGPSEEEFMSKRMPAYAHGGDIHGEEEQETEHYDSIAAAIMARKEQAASLHSDSDIDHEMHLAEGGEVDLDENAMEQPNSYYNRNEEAALKENYDDDVHSIHQPEDSNEHGDEREEHAENHLDKIDKIMSKMAKSKKFR